MLKGTRIQNDLRDIGFPVHSNRKRQRKPNKEITQRGKYFLVMAGAKTVSKHDFSILSLENTPRFIERIT